MINFILGLIIGGLIGVCVMCIFQINRDNELKKENKILRKNAEHNDKVVDKVNWENLIIKNRIHKTINFIEATIQIINQQPSRNVEEDNFILGRLESFIKTLGGDVDDE